MQNCIQLQTVGSCIRQGFSDTISRKNEHLHIEYYICSHAMSHKGSDQELQNPHHPILISLSSISDWLLLAFELIFCNQTFSFDISWPCYFC
jgi:hypothetical protein